MSRSESPGKLLAADLRKSVRAYRIRPGGGRNRPVLLGVTDKGTFVGGMTADGFLDQAAEVLLETGRFYRHGNSIAIEVGGPHDPRLMILTVQHRPEPNAAAVLANFFVVGVEGDRGASQSLVPGKLVGALLADEVLWARLPQIRHYSRRACFDLDFQLCHPGWNPGAGILLHGPAIVPAAAAPAYAPDARAVDRLPAHLKALLSEFGWLSDADLVNAVAMLLTGLLINHFIDDPHPVGILDANVSEVGKTLLVQCIARVLDDAEPPRITLAREDELEKRLGAELRHSRTSLILFDNVRKSIESAVLEQNTLSPLISIRRLGHSDTIDRPNTYLWFVTSNLTAGTTDFIRRGIPIRLFCEGDPRRRNFKGRPLQYAADHRLEILGELAAMVLRWVEQGRRLGPQSHRCARWAAVLGGILGANGLGEFFLKNVAEAEAQMDQGLLDLVTLAEHAAAKRLGDLVVPAGGDASGAGRTATQWAAVAADAQTELAKKLSEHSPKARATSVGMFLAGKVDREVTVETAAGPGAATLRRREAGAGQKLYYFEFAGPPAADETPAVPPGGDASAVAPKEGPDAPPWTDPAPDHMVPAPVGGHGTAADDGPKWF
jgi:hypothetical protein